MKVLLSIKPEFVEKIFTGEKRYEYRRTIFKKNVESIVVYATKPEGKIVGELFIEYIISDSPDSIWSTTQKYSGISHSFFQDYFGDRTEGYAIKIAKAIPYDSPYDPTQQNSNFRAPKSFCYIK
jgi:predicted transcriptional regulator